jgi:flagellar basal-body rod modification protein FlgD
MAAFASGIFNRAITASQSLPGRDTTAMANPASGEDGASSTSTSSAGISANDFLTLLVTEMKNQDPTANTDPNEYINQLVNVNSLEQLISINQELSEALGGSGSGGSSSGQSSTSTANSAGSNASGSTAQPAVSGAAMSATIQPISAGLAGSPSTLPSAARRASGNLSVPDAQPAAQSVAQALDGRSRMHSIAGQL